MKSILITIAISVYMTFTVVTIQVANKQTLATSDVTLDMITVMSRAFDEGGEGGQECSPNDCTSPQPLWAKRKFLEGKETIVHVVHLSCGFKGPKDDAPGDWQANLLVEYSNCVVGYEFNCVSSYPNYCCPSMMKHCWYGYGCTGGSGPA